jgi:hypothetical protein
MAKTLTIQLSDELERKLEIQAVHQNKTIEELVVEWLARQVSVESLSEPDPITPLLGTLSFDSSDVAENHDRYLSR